MINSLIIYSSTDGHTKIICERIINFSNQEDKVKIMIYGCVPCIFLLLYLCTSCLKSVRLGHSRLQQIKKDSSPLWTTVPLA